jgi:hypothetical protein
MNLNKALRLLPFSILLVFSVIYWYEILTVTHVAKIRHIIGGGLVIINIIVYFFSLRIGVILTGISLLLAAINLAAFTVTIVAKQYWFGPLTLPAFQPLTLLPLLIFLVFNLKYLLSAFTIITTQPVQSYRLCRYRNIT